MSTMQNVSTSNISSSVQHQNITSMANNMMQSNVCSTNMNNSMHHPSINTSSMNNYMQQNTSSLAMNSSMQQLNGCSTTSSFQQNVSSLSMNNSLMQQLNAGSSATSSFQQQNASSSSMNNSSMQQPNGGILSMNSQTVTTSNMTSSLQQAPINSAPSSQPQAETATELPKTQTKDWRVTDLDGEYDYECEGTATLNRPKGLVRLRPMAKITAKTREEIAEAIMDIPDSEFKSLINNQSRALDGWSSLDGSPRHGPSTVPRSATLKRAPPPPPPKRNNSGKAAQPEPREPPQVPKRNPKTTNESSEVLDFPPPPSPLPSAVEDKPEDSSESKDELFCNPLFRQRRKDSSDSASGVDASALPFANETVGTIKQKAARPYPSLPMNASQLRGDYNV